MFNVSFHSNDLSKYSFLVTGGAGFIGSHLVEYLLRYGAHKVRVLDNLSTGFQSNVDLFIENPSFEFINGDIRNLEDCKKSAEDIDYVFHLAALGSVPRSINDPLTTNEVNISGFLNILIAVRDYGIKRIVYAASSSTYGDSKELPKVEEKIGKPLSPYAVTKYVNELYADVFTSSYGVETVGLRYFNVFGPRQSSNGEYAAVIPLFIKAALNDESAVINGDGETTRDFTFIENAIQANVKAMFTPKVNGVFNVACGERTSLNQLWSLINKVLAKNIEANYQETRKGDIKDSLADIRKAQKILNYNPLVRIEQGLELTIRSINSGTN